MYEAVQMHPSIQYGADHAVGTSNACALSCYAS